VAQGFVTTWKDSKLRQKIPLPCVGLPHNSVLAPGGGMLSTSEDMAKWLNFLLRLAKGCPMSPNLNIIQLDTLKQILRSRVLANEQIGILSVPYGESLWEEMSPPTFALCQLRGNYRGLDISSHNGMCNYQQRA
jgi:CubicO group peptidase (beta-lactamase class C family)